MRFGRVSSSSSFSDDSEKNRERERERDQDRQDTDAARHGDLDAFDRLVVRHQDRVFNLCRWVIGDEDEAADAAQEAFVRAFRFLPKFRGDAAFSTWIGHIALNVARDFAARRKKAPLPFSGLGTEEEPDFEPVSQAISPSETLLKAERRRAVERALGQVPEHFRVVLVLYDLQGHSYEECSALLKLPLGTVKSRLSRARAALRQALGGDRELFDS
jgi:RNA polymerase sigma-70 factor (ECF subfamily)